MSVYESTVMFSYCVVENSSLAVQSQYIARVLNLEGGDVSTPDFGASGRKPVHPPI